MSGRCLSLLAALPFWSAFVFLSLPCDRSLADFEAAKEAYLRGEYATAFELALPSALEGDPMSRIGLGLLLARGDGVKADIVRSYSWFEMAAADASPEYRLARILALANRDYLGKQMSVEQLEEARLRAAMMQATPEAIEHDAQFGFSLASHADAEAMPSGAVGKHAPLALLQSIPTEFGIQLAALPAGNTERLGSEWSRLVSEYPALGKLRPSLIRMDLGNLGLYEGLRAGPFDSTKEAYETCAALLESGADCFVVGK